MGRILNFPIIYIYLKAKTLKVEGLEATFVDSDLDWCLEATLPGSEIKPGITVSSSLKCFNKIRRKYLRSNRVFFCPLYRWYCWTAATARVPDCSISTSKIDFNLINIIIGIVVD